MGLSEEIRRKLIETFKAEQSEHVQNISQGLLKLEKHPPEEERQALLQDIFREAHSLKGAARSVGISTIESIGHTLEDLLSLTQKDEIELSPQLFDLLYEALDGIILVIRQLEAGQSSPPAEVMALIAKMEQVKNQPEMLGAAAKGETAAPKTEHQNGENVIPVSAEKLDRLLDQLDKMLTQQPIISLPPEPDPIYTDTMSAASPQLGDETIRVSVSKLDQLMGQLSELLSTKIRSEQYLGQIRQVQTQMGEWYKTWLNSRQSYNQFFRTSQELQAQYPELKSLINFAVYNQEQLKYFDTHLNELSRQLANDTMRLSLVVNEIEEEVKQLRMMPLSTITTGFERMVRDVARQQKKRVKFSTDGEDTELDKRVLEQIKDPLIHLVRNAIAHGLETPAERKIQDKPPEGMVHLAAEQQGNHIIITIQDDGRGLDSAKIREVAVEKGLISRDEAEHMDETNAQALIFRSGLSTSQTIDDISGRGVGLDVVHKNVESLQGSLNVSSTPAVGTTFTIFLPLTLASTRGLLVQAGGQRFALPFSAISRMLKVPLHELETIQGLTTLRYNDDPVPVARLESLLDISSSARATFNDDEILTMVIIAVGQQRLGLIVDELDGEQEIVIKSLGKQLLKVLGFAGASILGSGEVILVLHAADLIRLANYTSSIARTDIDTTISKSQAKRILVVDDSITIRTLEKNILESAGYEVTLATDGQEALEKVTAKQPDLIVSDINMPRMDGFTLTLTLKQDQRFKTIPIILVTSLESPEDKAKGLKSGADAYIVKNKFDQLSLLDTIVQLV